MKSWRRYEKPDDPALSAIASNAKYVRDVFLSSNDRYDYANNDQNPNT